MTKASSLPYYPRFIFNCSDGKGFSTADLDSLKYVKDSDDKHGDDITQFVPGQRISVTWSTDDKGEVRSYEVDKIEIHQIKYDLDEPTFGMNSNDVMDVSGKPKKHMMDIYVFLKAVK